MGYLLTEIVVYLVIAALIGFAFGWLVKGASLDKYFEKCTKLMGKAKEALKAYYLTLTTTKKVLKEEKLESKETAKIEVPTPIDTVKESDEKNKPTLLREAPKDGGDKLSTIKGIGPVLEKKLNELGIYSFEQIASWDTEQEVWIGTQITFPKKVLKEEWVKQAKELFKNK